MRMPLSGAVWAGLFLAGAAIAAGPGPAEQVYRLSWAGLDVGAARLVLAPQEDEGAVAIRVEACSTGLADVLYPVADHFAGRARITDTGVQPREYRAERQENGDRTRKRIDFQSAPGQALFATPNEDGRKALELEGRTYDYLSALLALSQNPPAVAEVRELPVISGREVVRLRAEGQAIQVRDGTRVREIRLTRPDDDKTFTLWLPMAGESRTDLPRRLHVAANFGTIRARPAEGMPCSVSSGDGAS